MVKNIEKSREAIERDIEKMEKYLSTNVKDRLYEERKKAINESERIAKSLESKTKKLRNRIANAENKVAMLKIELKQESRPYEILEEKTDKEISKLDREINRIDDTHIRIQRRKKLLEVYELLEKGYVIQSYAPFGEKPIKIMKWYSNNYRPNGWMIVDIRLTEKGVHVKSDISKSYRKVGDIDDFIYSLKLTNGLKPIENPRYKSQQSKKCTEHSKEGETPAYLVGIKYCPVCENAIILKCSKDSTHFERRDCKHIKFLILDDSIEQEEITIRFSTTEIEHELGQR